METTSTTRARYTLEFNREAVRLVQGDQRIAAAARALSVGNPIKMSDSATDVTRSPLLGEHTEEVLAELGYGKADIDGLRAARVI